MSALTNHFRRLLAEYEKHPDWPPPMTDRDLRALAELEARVEELERRLDEDD